MTNGISFTYSPYICKDKSIINPSYRSTRANNTIRQQRRKYGNYSNNNSIINKNKNSNTNKNGNKNNNKMSELPKVKGREKDKLDNLLDNALIDKGVNRGKYAFNPFELYCAETLVNMGGDPNDVSFVFLVYNENNNK